MVPIRANRNTSSRNSESRLRPFGLLQVEKKDLGVEIACVDVGEIPPGRQRSPFAAVGGWDQAVRLLSLDPNAAFNQLAMQARDDAAGGTDR